MKDISHPVFFFNFRDKSFLFSFSAISLFQIGSGPFCPAVLFWKCLTFLALEYTPHNKRGLEWVPAKPQHSSPSPRQHAAAGFDSPFGRFSHLGARASCFRSRGVTAAGARRRPPGKVEAGGAGSGGGRRRCFVVALGYFARGHQIRRRPSQFPPSPFSS